VGPPLFDPSFATLPGSSVVEQVTVNHLVVGSIPTRAAISTSACGLRSWQAIYDRRRNALSLSKGFLFGPLHIVPEFHPTIPTPERVDGFAWVYVLQAIDGALYIGQTLDLVERLRKHRFGLGSKHIRDHGQPRLVYCEGPMPLAIAISREAQLKRWSRAKKEALIGGHLDRLKELSRSRREDQPS
jgi:putative endonuclease